MIKGDGDRYKIDTQNKKKTLGPTAASNKIYNAYAGQRAVEGRRLHAAVAVNHNKRTTLL